MTRHRMLTGHVARSRTDGRLLTCSCCGAWMVDDDPTPSCQQGCSEVGEGETCVVCVEEANEELRRAERGASEDLGDEIRQDKRDRGW